MAPIFMWQQAKTNGNERPLLLSELIKIIKEETCVVDIDATTKIEDLGIDSLEFIELMQILNIPEEKWDKVQTVEDLLVIA